VNERYSRHYSLDEVGPEGQLNIANAKVLVIGAGGLGCPVLQYLTSAGVGTIGIVDGDFVSLSNLQRQILFNTSDIGELKVKCAVDKLQAINPEITFNQIPNLVTSLNAFELIADYDIVVDCTDQIHMRYLLSDVCAILSKPLVFGAIHKFEGQVSVFNYQDGPNYRDLYPNPPSPESVPNCNDVGVLGVLPGIIGVAQANEVLKIIVGYGEVLSGKLWMFNAKNNSSYTVSFSKREKNSVPQTKEEIKNTNYIGYCNTEWEISQSDAKKTQRIKGI
jgi:molybdopterin/thiamine biosynthesis adenylyltransferase